MEINISKTDDVTTIELSGRLDTVTAPKLQDELLLSFDGAKTVVLDFGNLKYVASAGLRVLLIAEKTARSKQVQMKLINVSQDVMEILEITGFADKLTIV
jgi:anti-anti-sigma factor